MPLLQFFKSHNLSEIIQETFIIMVTVNNMPNFCGNSDTFVIILYSSIILYNFGILYYIIVFFEYFELQNILD